MKKKAFIIGAYGCGNKGDDAILTELTVPFIEKGYDICVTNGTYENMAEQLPVSTVRCRMDEGKLSFEMVADMIRCSFVQMARIIGSDVLIYGGGSSIHDLTWYNLVYMFFWQGLARMTGKKVCYLGMGVGPVDTKRGKRLCSRYLKKADMLVVRDQRGYDICRSIGADNAIHACDTVFQNRCNLSDDEILKLLGKYGLESGQYITVSACSWFKSSDFWKRNEMDLTGAKKNFRDCLQRLYERSGKRLIFVPSFKYDYEFGLELQEALGAQTLVCIDAAHSCTEMAGIISNAYIHFGMRMHSTIFALRAGVMSIPVVYDEKVRQLSEQFGIEKYCIDIDSLTPDSVESVFRMAVDNYETNRNLIAAKARELKKLSEDYLEKASSVIP